MAVTVYKSNDASAPTLSGTAGTMINVLDACLVNGYGSKSAAGWAKEYSGANKAVYRAPSGNRFYLRVDHTGTTNVRVVAYESMSGIDTGTNAFPTDAQQTGGGYWYVSNSADATARAWMIIAGPKGFYINLGSGLTAAGGMASSTAYQQLEYFGDFTTYRSGDAYNAVLHFNASAVQYNTFAALTGFTVTQTDRCIARPYTQTVGAVRSGGVWDQPNSGWHAGVLGYTYPDSVTGGIRLTRYQILENGSVIRGHMPGLWVPQHALPGNPDDTFNGSGALAGRSFIMVDCSNSGTRGRVCIETSDTWD